MRGDGERDADAADLARDRAVLETNAQALETARRVWKHANTEFLSDIDVVMETVVTDRPPIYGVPLGPFGPAPAVSDMAGVEAHYKHLYEARTLTHWRTMLEVRSPWYTFFEGVAGDVPPEGGDTVWGHNIVLFPMSVKEEILGEQAWHRWPVNGGDDSAPLAGITPETSTRHANRDLFDTYLRGLNENDAGLAASVFDPRAHVTSRDYGQRRSGPYMNSEAGDFYRRFFDRFEVEAVDHVQLLVLDWYVFNELDWTVRSAAGERFRFATVDMMPMVGGKFISRLGYGTEMIPV